MSRLLVLGFVLFFVLGSCKKEVFPENEQIIGVWIEDNTASEKIRIEFRTDGTCLLQYSETSKIDTLIYQLKDEDQRLWFGLLKEGIYHSHHQIKYNKKEDQLTIWGLTANISENAVHTFVRE